jgi:hypothetical protein
MRFFLSLIVIAYLIAAGVALAPTVREKWNTATAGDFAASVANELPGAFAWPLRAYYRVRGA